MSNKSESLLNDSDIIARTESTEPDAKGRIAKRFTLSDGHVVQSAHMAPESFAGRWWIQWAKDVRGVDEARILQREQDAATARSAVLEPYLHAPTEEDVAARAPSSESATGSPSASVELPDDPDQMIRDKLRRMSEENYDRLKQIERLQAEHATLAKSIDKWLKIAESLGIDLNATEPAETAAAPEQPEESDDGKDDTGSPAGGDQREPADGGAQPAQSKRRRAKRGPRAKRAGCKSATRGADGSSEAVTDE